MKKIGVIGISDAWSSQHLVNVVKEKTGFGLLIDMESTFYDSDQKTVFYKNGNDLFNLKDLDAVIIKKISKVYSPELAVRLELLDFLKQLNIPFFSEPDKISACYSRLANTMILQKGSIPMPPTVITESVDQAIDTVKKFKHAVFKPLYSTKARGMMLLNSEDNQLSELIEHFKKNNPVMYIQKKIEIPEYDLGVSFLGGKYVGTYSRCKNKDSWNTTILAGGKYEQYYPTDDIIMLAKKAQDLFGLAFTCVDVALTADGPFVFEVSAFGGFRGLKEGCNIDIAEMFVEYVLNQI